MRLTSVSRSDQIQENLEMGQAVGQTADPHTASPAGPGRDLRWTARRVAEGCS